MFTSAAGMLKFGVVPPDEIIGPLAVTLVTVPAPIALLVSAAFKSVIVLFALTFINLSLTLLSATNNALPTVVTPKLVNAPSAVVAPVPPFNKGNAVPLYVNAKVPEVVTGEPLTVNIDGAVKPTLVTVPEPPPPPLYCGMFRVLPINVAAPLVPVVVNVMLFCLAANLEVRFNKVVSASLKYGDNIVDVSEILTLLLKVFQSVDVKKPFTEVVACVMDKVLFAVKLPPPCNGAVVAIVIVLFAGVNPKAACLLLNVVQSADNK